MSRDVPEVNTFWQAYRATVLRQGMPQTKAEWLVRWAQRFARSVQGIPLRARTAAHVTAFLSDLRQQANVQAWQVDQAQEALRRLYQDCLPQPWARPWPPYTPVMETAQGLTPRISLRDEVTPHEVEARHHAVLSQLRTAMRLRHYALRTEQTYAHWMRRFVTFHRLKSPRDLGPEAVKEYLEFLAEERQVTASTQNQALNALAFL